jgi:formylglycine-generating enzyme required for sulfatase activity
MKFRLIPPGEFMMGQTQEDTNRLVKSLEQGGADEFSKFVARMSSPIHKVRLTKPFYCGAHEVTVGQYRKFIEDEKYVSSAEQLGVKDPLKWTSSAVEPNAEQRAVIGVSWDDAKAFCKWLSKKDGFTYDLPTEAQWEYACRAGTTTVWSFGDEASGLKDHAVQGRRSFSPAEVVGTKSPNPFGLFDMHGNADEWCLDWHLRDFYARSPLEDPVCLTDPQDPLSGRVARGGASGSAPWWTRSTTRAYDFQATPKSPKGFRVVMLAPESVSWTRLFNGKDLAGWKIHPSQESNWKVEDGILVGTGGYSHLFTERGDFENFELRVEAKISNLGNSGVMLRSEFGFNFDLTRAGGAGQLPRGMEVDIHPGIQPEPAGSIWHLGEPQWMEKASEQLVKPDEWFTLHVIARGKQLEVRIDGKPVIRRVANQVAYDKGHIVLLQQMKGAGQVWFHKIEIKELPATPTP